MKHVLKPVVAATALALTAFAGSAAAQLDQLYFSQSAGWVDPENDASGVTDYFGSANTAFSMLTTIQSNCSGFDGPAGTSAGMGWTGTQAGEGSSICINSFDSTSSDANFSGLNQENKNPGEWNEDEFWVIDELIQENRVLGGGAADFPNPLWKADTLADFFVYTNGVGNNPIVSDTGSDTRIEFWETVNTTGNWAGCDPTDPYRTVVPAVEGAGPCADRYRVALGEFANVESNPFNGFIYTIKFTLFPGPVSSTLNGLPLGETIVVEDPLGDGLLIDVYTPEVAPGYSKLYVAASWSVRAVPEPSVLALFGAGILGLGLANRRRKQRA